MKRGIVLILAIVLLPAMLQAAPVDSNLAQQVAQNFINSIGDSLNAQQPINQPRRLKRVAKQAANTPPYYIFNKEDGGFVIVAGDDCATPILGYSNEGGIDLDNMPIQLQELLDAYAAEIQYAVDNNLQATDAVAKSWNLYRKAPQSRTTTAAVNALITTSWNQYPLYNDKCPVDASLSALGGHPTTGCVATAMAQIMKYWNYPKKGTGSKSYNSEYYGTLSANFSSTAYDWQNMPLKLTSSTSSTQNNAVATLMYHCGVAVSMNYNADGRGSSGAFIIDYGYGRASAERALTTYFGYASTVKGKTWDQTISTTSWSNMLKEELNNQRPVLYGGFMSSGGGHAFICDGYDNNNKFHFNWGWGGQANGFFSLTTLTPGNYNFSVGQQAIIGIQPADGTITAKEYDLYMNTDLAATNTDESTSLEPNIYYFGNTISFTAKVENNGTGVFNGDLKVGVYTDDGVFVAWSNESYHFSLNAGQHTVQKTYTFPGGTPFKPGKYRAYMYYQDDDETESKLVKTDEGILFTEYNNVAFTVKFSGNLRLASSYTLYDAPFDKTFTAGQRVRMDVKVKNISTSTIFKGKLRLCLFNLDGTLAEDLCEMDYSQDGISANTLCQVTFNAFISIEPGTYNMALQVKPTGQSKWSYVGYDIFPNPVSVIIKAPELFADEDEPNNSQSMATNLFWEIDQELEGFGTRASLHDDADIDYYKLIFPSSNQYKVSMDLYDKYNPGGWWYENADAQFGYSVGGDTYSEYSWGSTTLAFDGPNILYIRVKPYGMNGLGYYELAGDIVETANPNIQDLTCAQASQIASGLSHNTPTTEIYNVVGYVTETDGVVSRGQQIFWMADTENGGRVFESYWCNVPEQIKVGDYVSVKGQIMRYNSTYEIKHGDVLLLERKSSEAIEDIEGNGNPTKILQDGHIYILRGDKTFTIDGQLVK